MFKAMLDFLEETTSTDQDVYLVEVGDISTQNLKNWIEMLGLLGQKLMQVSRGLGLMRGRDQPNQDDFVQATYLLTSGRISAVFDRPIEEDNDRKDIFPE